jgi:pyruvate/2-oxoglutarate dehydrogenase complex dihydrolipoamide acyltransferase (E2) component
MAAPSWASWDLRQGGDAGAEGIPAVNAEIDGEDIIYREFVNLGIAVGTERAWWCR